MCGMSLICHKYQNPSQNQHISLECFIFLHYHLNWTRIKPLRYNSVIFAKNIFFLVQSVLTTSQIIHTEYTFPRDIFSCLGWTGVPCSQPVEIKLHPDLCIRPHRWALRVVWRSEVSCLSPNSTGCLYAPGRNTSAYWAAEDGLHTVQIRSV